MTRLLDRLVVLLAATLAVWAFAPTASAAQPLTPDDSIGIRLLDAPVERRNDPRAQVYIVDHLTPGSSIERRIEVTNTTADPARVALYAAGARIQDGEFTFFSGREGNELTSWTNLDPPAVTVAADGAAEATVRINVPPDASEGERYGVIWAELPAAGGGDIVTINRVGIRIYLSVGPGGEPPSDFTITSLQPSRTDQGAPQLTATVDNTGGRALDLGGELTLTSGPGGISAGPFDAPLGTTVAIEQTAEVVFTLNPELPAGPWTAQVTLRSGQAQRSAASTLTFPVTGEAPALDDDSPKVPWMGIAVAAALVALAAVFLLRRRRPQGSKHEAPTDARGE